MIISVENKYLFIEVPKTGSTTIRRFLLAHDKTAVFNQLIDKNGNWRKVPTHISARRVKNILKDRFIDYEVFGFIRHPFSKVVSSYFFYKNGRAKKRVQSGNAPWHITARVYFAILIPLNLWIVLYPSRSSYEFILDKNGTVLLDFIGLQEKLEDNFKDFLIKKRLSFYDLPIGKHNVGDYKDETINLNSWSKTYIKWRFQKDFKLYNEVNVRKSSCK